MADLRFTHVLRRHVIRHDARHRAAARIRRNRRQPRIDHRRLRTGPRGITRYDQHWLALLASPDPIWVSRMRDGVLVDVSDSFCHLTGRERSSLIGRSVADLGLWVDPAQHKALLRTVQLVGEVRGFNARLRASDGESRAHLIGATRLASQPEPLMLSIGHDVTSRLEVEQALSESELRYQSFVEAMPLGVLITQHGEIKYANPKASELSGYARDELVGRSFAPLIHAEDRARVADLHRRRMAGEVDASSYDLRMKRKDGALRHWRLHVQTVDWGGKPSGLSILTDVTDQVLVERRLRELSSIVEQTNDAIMLTSTDGLIQYVNPGFERMTGYGRDEVIGKTPAALKSGAHDKNFYRLLWQTISEGRPFHAQVVNRRKDGTLFHAVKTITPMVDDDGKIVSYVNIDMDFTAQYEAQQRTTHLALHDNLTGLPNRNLLVDRLGQAIAQFQRESVPFSVLFVDLDGFKAINDRQGHQAGDEVLKEVACRLSHRMRSVDTVARIGGDEFVVLLAGVSEPGAAWRIATELVTAIRESISLLSGPCHVGASVGIGLFPRDGDTHDAILQSADHAMYEAKRAGGNRVRLSCQTVSA